MLNATHPIGEVVGTRGGEAALPVVCVFYFTGLLLRIE